MKIKVVSDLHLEFSEFILENKEHCDTLILSGDIVVAQDLHDYPVLSDYVSNHGSRQVLAHRYRQFFSHVTSIFDNVIYVSGNHEFYRGKWVAGLEYLQEECAKYSNLYFLEDDTVTIDDVVFIGGALWTDMNKRDPLTIQTTYQGMNDFSQIRNDAHQYSSLKPLDTVVRHEKTLAYFKKTLRENSDKKCVLVCHHGPSHLSCAEQYKDDVLMNGAFYSDLSEFVLDHPQIKLLTHGHTHTGFDYMLGETRVVCNPRGYSMPLYVENPDYNPNVIVEV